MKALYLLLDLAAISVPFLFSFHPRLRFYREWKYVFPAMVITGIIYLVWDEFFTRAGIWGFNERYLIGIYFGSLPLEELLFFICVPYASLFTYHSFGVLFPLFNIPAVRLAWILAIPLTLTGLIFYDRWYTAFNLLLCALALILAVKFTPELLPRFFLTYFVILIPFFIMNGILTGSLIEEEVVWYNNSENLDLRMFTIPVEDMFYALSMILINLLIWEKLRRSFP